jgi:outer membrane autotransporter protein
MITFLKSIFVSTTVAIMLMMKIGAAQSQTNYSTIIAGSNWDVPAANLLGYVASTTSGLSNATPLGDQTTWGCQLGVNGCTTTSTSGMKVTSVAGGTTSFVGSATGVFALGPITFIPSYASISGTVAPSGQISMVFTPTNSSGVITGAPTTLGFGQFVTYNGANAIQMQMFTPVQGLYVTHWANMVPYDGTNATQITSNPTTTANPAYSWTAGTVWKIVDPILFGSTKPGRFTINNYSGGYFTGTGIGPDGKTITFSQLGSVTPEGKVLFATLKTGSAEIATSYGSITGSNTNASMVLAGYNNATAAYTGYYTILTEITPYVSVTAAANNPAAAGAAASLYNLGGTALGFTGAMAPVITAIDNLSGTAQSNAISQTMPVLTGAGSQATASSQRMFNQNVLARQNALAGKSGGEDIIGNKEVWGRIYGAWGNQATYANVAGYNSNTGGLVLGADKVISSEISLGAVLGISTSSMSSNNSAAPSNLNINSYQLGGYGDYKLTPALKLNYQADIAVNQNSGSRNISFYGVTANSSYTSYTGHLGTGVQQNFVLNDKTSITPTFRVDYLTVQSQAYNESNAGVLNLNVNNQTWNELFTTAGLRADYEFMPKVKLSTNVSAGYNSLNRQVLLGASYAGGGNSFTTYGLQLSPWLYNAGAGISGVITKDIELNVRYDLQTSTSGYLNQIASAKLKFYL